MRKDRQIRRCERRQRRVEADNQASGPVAIPLPDDPAEFLERFCFWPHADTRLPVASINPIQRDYLARRTAFRFDPNTGERVYGADIVAKPRRVWMTSLTLGCILWAMARWPGIRCLTILHTEAKDTGPELRRQMGFAASRLPAEWGLRPKWARGVLSFSNGSRWGCITAGHSEEVADSVVKSGGVDILHLSEAGMYRHAETTFGASYNALPRSSGWVIAESTFSATRDHWFAASYRATRDGAGRFMAAFFWRWYEDPRKVIPVTDPEYMQVMAPGFEAAMKAEDLAAERSLTLTDEQRAWRRANYCRGTLADRRKARIENPEDDESIFGSDIEPWLDLGALDAIAAQQTRAIDYHKVTQTLGVFVYRELGADEHLSGGVDTATLFGRDLMAGVFLASRARDQVAEIHGKALDSEFADAMIWLFARLGLAVDSRRYTLVVESNRGRGVLGELQRRRFRLWTDGRSKLPGFSTQKWNRPQLMDHLAEAIEGKDGSGPTVEIRSKMLVHELRHVVVVDEKPQAAQGFHDDLAMALALTLHAMTYAKAPAADWQAAVGRVDVDPEKRLRMLESQFLGRGGPA